MGPERIELSQTERDRLKVLHELEQGHLRQGEAGRRLGLSERQVRRLLGQREARGDRAVVHGLRGRPSNRKIAEAFRQRVIEQVRQRYSDFGPTLASEHLAAEGMKVSRETLRKWMAEAKLWRVRYRPMKQIHVWRERKAAFGEMVMWDSSPHAWLEDRGPRLHLIAMIDDATSWLWGHFAEHDVIEENLRTLEGWLRRYGRPVAAYTDRHSLFTVNRPASLDEQLRGEPARTQIGRALRELGIEWIAARSPQAKGRIERLFATLQDRLVKEMRLAEVAAVEQANQFFQERFVPWWNQRFAVEPRSSRDAHRPLGGELCLESILSVREPRVVTRDYTVSWHGQRWGVAREHVQAGLRRARVGIERRLDRSHLLRFRGQSLPLVACPAAPPSLASPSGLRPPGLANDQTKPKYIPPPDHPWRKPWKRTFLNCK